MLQVDSIEYTFDKACRYLSIMNIITVFDCQLNKKNMFLYVFPIL